MNKQQDFFARLEEAMVSLRKDLAQVEFLKLPHVLIEDDKVGHALPAKTSAICFLFHEFRDLLYVGKAVDLRSRWLFTGNQHFKWEPRSVHHCLSDAIALKSVTLHYWELPRKYLSYVELLLLAEFSPPWNSHDTHRGPSKTEKDLLIERFQEKGYEVKTKYFRKRHPSDKCVVELPFDGLTRQLAGSGFLTVLKEAATSIGLDAE